MSTQPFAGRNGPGGDKLLRRAFAKARQKRIVEVGCGLEVAYQPVQDRCVNAAGEPNAPLALNSLPRGRREPSGGCFSRQAGIDP